MIESMQAVREKWVADQLMSMAREVDEKAIDRMTTGELRALIEQLNIALYRKLLNIKD